MMHPSSPSLRRALIIDDDKAQGLIIAAIAASNGYQVTNVSCFDNAVVALESEPFQCITIDLALGNRDGIEVLRLAASLPGAPRIIFISGCDDRILEAAVRMAEIIGVTNACSIQKPFRPADLRRLFEDPAGRATIAGPVSREPVTGAMIERGLCESEFHALFQPKVSLSDGRLVGCEALARWDHAGYGRIPPAEFIPAAEGSGHIGRITATVMEHAFPVAAMMARRDAGFKLAVNLSPTLLSDLSLPDEIDDLLQKHDLPAANLIIEVTESVAIADHAKAVDILLRLRIKGIGISIDDFGTGYASLALLTRIPFTELKIDRSFVANCLVDDSMRKIVAGSIEIGHQFNMDVVAEGVETAEVARFLYDLGCDIGQGYLYARPLSATDLLSWSGRRS
jgi:EAL domain-containing protein (putative c-di-GMP-specific phosphodiesterase class I)